MNETVTGKRVHQEPMPISEINIGDTVKAWAVVLTILTGFIIVVAGSILYGWPKYQRYLAVEAAKTEIAVAAVYDAASTSRYRTHRPNRISPVAGKETGLSARERWIAVVSRSNGSGKKTRQIQNRQQARKFGTTARRLLSKDRYHELRAQQHACRLGFMGKGYGEVSQRHASAGRPRLSSVSYEYLKPSNGQGEMI